MNITTEQCPVCGAQAFNCVRTEEGEACFCTECGYTEEYEDE